MRGRTGLDDPAPRTSDVGLLAAGVRGGRGVGPQDPGPSRCTTSMWSGSAGGVTGLKELDGLLRRSGNSGEGDAPERSLPIGVRRRSGRSAPAPRRTPIRNGPLSKLAGPEDIVIALPSNIISAQKACLPTAQVVRSKTVPALLLRRRYAVTALRSSARLRRAVPTGGGVPLPASPTTAGFDASTRRAATGSSDLPLSRALDAVGLYAVPPACGGLCRPEVGVPLPASPTTAGFDASTRRQLRKPARNRPHIGASAAFRITLATRSPPAT